ncbi:MAG: hypothetical protein KA004_11210 [Verrucomicrobiales bacterium]|nr:hypothetical protein [Verrucomicrobiales bacterium]
MSMTKPTQPVHCPNCDLVFYPSVENPDQVVQCPACFMRTLLSSCRPAAEPKLEFPERWVTEADETEARRQIVRGRQGKFLLAAALGVVALAALLLVRYLPEIHQTPSGADTAGNSPAEVEKQKALAAATALAKTALEAPDWQTLLHSVRKPDHVRPLMEWYYKHRTGGYVPYHIQRIKTGIYQASNPPSVVVKLATADSRMLDVVVEQTSEGWKLDWEAFSNVHGIRWRLFLSREKEFSDSLIVPVRVARLPLSLLTSGFYSSIQADPAATKSAARLFVTDPEAEYAAAIFPADAPLAAELLSANEEENVRKFVVEVRLRGTDPDQYPPCVEIKRILQHGWDMPEVTELPK